jgi:hypothetical protein
VGKKAFAWLLVDKAVSRKTHKTYCLPVEETSMAQWITREEKHRQMNLRVVCCAMIRIFQRFRGKNNFFFFKFLAEKDAGSIGGSTFWITTVLCLSMMMSSKFETCGGRRQKAHELE